MTIENGQLRADAVRAGWNLSELNLLFSVGQGERKIGERLCIAVKYTEGFDRLLCQFVRERDTLFDAEQRDIGGLFVIRVAADGLAEPSSRSSMIWKASPTLWA